MKGLSPEDFSLKRGGAWKTVPSPKELALRSSVTVIQTEVQASGPNTPSTLNYLKALSTTSENMPPYKFLSDDHGKKKEQRNFCMNGGH
ncbi:hypothetical protein [Absidia glauca]|uniref:Uncharacterized protein n=1 Tax=Absidia glauca TaxID=4829 RepID=A0A163J8S1_ABSGL|nr:hypothetical protein [Absidia glauca]